MNTVAAASGAVEPEPPRLWPVVAGCTVLAALSLTLPSTLTYDSWSWLTWGREVAHLNLDTAGFVAAWKPLPVLADLLFSFAGHVAPLLWLLVSRAGGLVGVVIAYRLARRTAGATAGVVAALALLSSAGFADYLLPLGMSEPLLAGIALAAIERGLEGRHLQACMLVYVASLLRPEVWPFLGLYVLWLWRAEPGRRVMMVVLVVLVPVLWFGPDLVGSGDAFRSVHRADIPTQGGPLVSAHPGLAVLAEASRYLLVPFGLTVLAAVAAAAGSARRRRYDRVALTTLSVTAAWLAIECVATAAGRSSGDQRYLIVAGAGASVLAGIGWGRIVQVAGRLAAKLAGDLRFSAGRVATSSLLVVVTAPSLVTVAGRLPANFRDVAYQVALSGRLPAAVEAAGGRGPIVACGPVYGGFYQAPLLAWQLRLHLGMVRTTTPPAGVAGAHRTAQGLVGGALAHYLAAVPHAPGIVFASRPTRTAALPPALPTARSGFPVTVHVGPWDVASSCGRPLSQ